jgi:hypothetical protein
MALHLLSLNHHFMNAFQRFFNKYALLLAVTITTLGAILFIIPNDDLSTPLSTAIIGILPKVLLIAGSSTVISIILPMIVKYVEDGTVDSKPFSNKIGKIKMKISGAQNQPEMGSDTIAAEHAQFDLIEEQIQTLQNGISLQIDKLSRSGTINLVIGLALTIIAIIILINVVYSDVPAYLFDETTGSAYKFFIHMIPRFSLVIFIEVFSFFFLNLYKKSHDDIKYFHNEKTNIDSKIVALKSAIIFGNKNVIDKIILNFSNVERNFVIKKNETSIELERLKIENSGSEILFNKMSKLLPFFKDAK